MDLGVGVLWVEGDAAIHEIYEPLLSAIGVGEFVFVTSGAEGLRAALAQTFYLILLDCACADMSAAEMVRRIRAEGSPSRSARIVIVADDGASPDVAEADAQLFRPVTARALRDELVHAAGQA
jgi:CheY-like chemotaxis protein